MHGLLFLRADGKLGALTMVNACKETFGECSGKDQGLFDCCCALRGRGSSEENTKVYGGETDR